MRIAAWNLERLTDTESVRGRGVLERIRAVDAAISVLNESATVVELGDQFFRAHSQSPARGRPEGEYWTSIRSRHELELVETYDPEVAVCARVSAPGGPWLIYGTVLPYAADRGESGAAANWSEHYRVIEAHAADWESIRRQNPDARFVVAGDFNQSRDGRVWPWKREWYGTKDGRAQLTKALNALELSCLTETDFVAQRKLASRSTVMHICADAQTALLAKSGALEATYVEGIRLSDHNIVLIDLAV